MKKNVCIIGNSEKVLNSKLGHIIDEFDIVVRFNKFVIEGFEEYVGTKTDYISMSPSLWEDPKKIHPITNCKNIIAFKYKDRDIEKIYPDLNIKYVKWYRPKNKENTCPTTAFHIVRHFLDETNYNVYIHGIGDGGSTHYWDKNHKHSKKHKLDSEELEYKTYNNIRRLEDVKVEDYTDYLNQAKIKHNNKKAWPGESLVPHINRLNELMRNRDIRNILDWGCGKADYYPQNWIRNYNITKYDPAIKNFNIYPPLDNYDLVICTDVLEHIPEDNLDFTITNIFKRLRPEGICYFSVCCRKAVMILQNGKNAHASVKDKQWWIEKFKQFDKNKYILTFSA